ncbi:YopX family protein [Enterococcus faecalis]|uniref:YopX family protein n=1 Tax=Enterococcus faecalis TaxID=1351 RepID=UPI001926D1A6|nr:hypothetical protein [Enterococcus faecalis]
MIPKFRAWDDINKKMIYDFYREKIETVDGWYKGELVVRNKNEIDCDLLYSSKEEYIFRHVKELPLMQSTGLKDKNGVEIFEGDIVQYRDGEYSYLGIVKRDCYQFFIDGIEPDDNYDFIDVSNTFDGTSSLEVIGNIWDNPELLEVAE